MGTKLLFYRHDLFNAWGFNGRGFSLDPEYLDKWVFQNWERSTYNLKELFISNSDAVVMQEFSCWTLDSQMPTRVCPFRNMLRFQFLNPRLYNRTLIIIRGGEIHLIIINNV